MSDTNGVFEWTTDRAFFSDKAELNIREGELRESRTSFLSSEQSIPIGGPQSLYGRLLTGTTPGGNAIAIKYGRRKTFVSVPRIRMTLRSEATPITCAEALVAFDRLFENATAPELSLLEMTADLTKASVSDLHREVFSRTRHRITYRGGMGLETFYVGARTSPWSVRVYRKSNAVTRFEYIFRRAFLQARRIVKPQDALQLRHIHLTNLCACRRVDRRNLRQLLAGVPMRQRDQILRIASDHPSISERALRNELRQSVMTCFPLSEFHWKLERMRQRFIW